MVESVSQLNPPNRLACDGFHEKTILLTGGTGFLGKLLIEKILRTCPLVKKIYVLIRSKKGINAQDRMMESFSGPVFNLLKQVHGEEILRKVVAIEGDISELGLDLSQENRKILVKNVEIIYHIAASIRFDDPLKKAVLINTRGTKLMLELAKECKNLMVFVHVSTAYCYPQERVLFEKAYPSPADPHTVIRVVETMNEDVINVMAKKIMGQYPNTYVFTKALAEGLVNEQLNKLPIIIVRPSIVVPIWKEPVPGWIDNINGPAGFIVAAGKGVFRTMYCDPKCYADFLPADIAVNAMLLATYDYLIYKTRQVYNLTSSFEYKATWAELVNIGVYVVTTKLPFNWVVWYPGGSAKSSRLMNNICVILFHYIPAILLDSLIMLSGHKAVLWGVQKKISKISRSYEYYANNQWDFNNENALQVRAYLNETEKKIYKIDGEGLDKEQYFYNCVHALRLYYLKEGDDTISTARRHIKIMWILDQISKISFGYLLWKYFVYPLWGLIFELFINI